MKFKITRRTVYGLLPTLSLLGVWFCFGVLPHGGLHLPHRPDTWLDPAPTVDWDAKTKLQVGWVALNADLALVVSDDHLTAVLPLLESSAYRKLAWNQAEDLIGRRLARKPGTDPYLLRGLYLNGWAGGSRVLRCSAIKTVK